MDEEAPKGPQKPEADVSAPIAAAKLERTVLVSDLRSIFDAGERAHYENLRHRPSWNPGCHGRHRDSL
jgi:hypothetical protein